MLALLSQKSRLKTQNGISVTAAGFSVARVRQREGMRPELEACTFHPLLAEADAAKDLASLAREYKLGKAPCNAVMEPLIGVRPVIRFGVART